MSWQEKYQKYFKNRQRSVFPSCFCDEGNGNCARPVIQEGGVVNCGFGNPNRCKFSPFRTGDARWEVGGPIKTQIVDGGSMTH